MVQRPSKAAAAWTVTLNNPARDRKSSWLASQLRHAMIGGEFIGGVRAGLVRSPPATPRI